MKRPSFLSALFFFLLLSALACGQSGAPGGEKPSADTPGLHAGKEVTPGSYEDWCGEHEVQESMCTRCNPSLSAAFKATGDWCVEHNLPESQCKKCNPDLKIERPPKPEEK